MNMFKCQMCEEETFIVHINEQTNQLVCKSCLDFWNKPLEEKYDKVIAISEEMKNLNE